MSESNIVKFPAPDVIRLRDFHADLTEALDQAGWEHSRTAFAISRLDEIDACAKHHLPKDDLHHLSANAVFQLAIAYGEVWDLLHG